MATVKTGPGKASGGGGPPAQSAQYTARDIQVLGGLEAVRRRPGMYIGSTDQRGLHHLVYEITDNSIDEGMAGFCDHVEVVIHKDGRVTVWDNGRGIPTDLHEKTGKSALETVMTYLHAGGKFGGQVYKVSGGLHGVGASVVNALSETMWAEVRRSGKVYVQEYERGAPVSKVHEEKETRYRSSWQATGQIPAAVNGTTVSFVPDHKVFAELDYDFTTLAQRFRECAYLVKGIWIRLLDERDDQELTFCFEGGIKSFVRHLNRERSVIQPLPIYIENQLDSTAVEAALQYNDAFTEATFSFANCINTIDGGSHLTGFRSALTRVLNEYARKQKILKDDDANLSGDDVREGLVAVISVRLPEPQFEGQTKTRLGNPEVKSHVETSVADGLSQYLDEHPAGGPPHHREVHHLRPGAGGRPQGARPGRPQRAARRHDPARQAGRLLGARPGAVRALPGRGRLGGRVGEAGARPPLPGDPAATGQDPERGEGARRTRSSATPRSPPSSRRSPPAPARTSTRRSCATTASSS